MLLCNYQFNNPVSSGIKSRIIMNNEKSSMRLKIIKLAINHLVTRANIADKLSVENKSLVNMIIADLTKEGFIKFDSLGFLISNVSNILPCKVGPNNTAINTKDGKTIPVCVNSIKNYFPNELVQVGVFDDIAENKVIGFSQLLEKVFVDLHIGKSDASFSVNSKDYHKVKITSGDAGLSGDKQISGTFECVESNYGPRELIVDKELGEISKSERVYYETLREKNIPISFSEDEELEAASVWANSDLNERDWTSIPFVSIDSKTARDLDDLVFVEKNNDGWTVFVAISDVSSVILEGSMLDDAARKRGGSLYVGGKCFPMFPDVISYIACSLLPGIDKNAIVVEMNVSNTGELESYRFVDALVKSHKKFSYVEVMNIYNDNPSEADSSHHEMLKELFQLQKALVSSKNKRGGATLYTENTYPQFNKEASFDGFFKISPSLSNSVVEEVMNLTNVVAAKYLKLDGKPTIYRYHPPLHHDDIVPINKILGSIGVPKLKSPLTMLDVITARSSVELKSPNLLLAFDSALSKISTSSTYSDEKSSHYGLAVDDYVHFTSPIRRYPDLIVHRMIKAKMSRDSNKEIAGSYEYSPRQIKEIIHDVNAGFKRNKETANLINNRFSCNYWESKKRESFDAQLSSIGTNYYHLYIGENPITAAIEVEEYQRHTDEPLDFMDSIKVRVKNVDHQSGQVLFTI